MNKNLEVAKKIIGAYWHEVMNDAAYGFSGIEYKEAATTLLYLDEDLETHIKTVIKIMKAALKELKNE